MLAGLGQILLATWAGCSSDIAFAAAFKREPIRLLGLRCLVAGSVVPKLRNGRVEAIRRFAWHDPVLSELEVRP